MSKAVCEDYRDPVCSEGLLSLDSLNDIDIDVGVDLNLNLNLPPVVSNIFPQDGFFELSENIVARLITSRSDEKILITYNINTSLIKGYIANSVEYGIELQECILPAELVKIKNSETFFAYMKDVSAKYVSISDDMGKLYLDHKCYGGMYEWGKVALAASAVVGMVGVAYKLYKYLKLDVVPAQQAALPNLIVPPPYVPNPDESGSITPASCLQYVNIPYVIGPNYNVDVGVRFPVPPQPGDYKTICLAGVASIPANALFSETYRHVDEGVEFGPSVVRFGMHTLVFVGNPVNGMATLGVLHPAEYSVLCSAVEYLDTRVAAEGAIAAFKNNVVLIDFFVRVGAQKDIDVTRTHSVALWKNKNTDIVLIDPNNRDMSKFIKENHANVGGYSISILREAENRYQKFYDAVPVIPRGVEYNHVRDCIDIAVKIGFAINEFQSVTNDYQGIFDALYRDFGTESGEYKKLSKLKLLRDAHSSSFPVRGDFHSSYTMYLNRLPGAIKNAYFK